MRTDEEEVLVGELLDQIGQRTDAKDATTGCGCVGAHCRSDSADDWASASFPRRTIHIPDPGEYTGSRIW